ncbi:MAG TPA: hypothetical protein VMJ64_18010 [Anaerolineales bacterium]|nr:hypothetical protein [Anaerolineales bacterium]
MRSLSRHARFALYLAALSLIGLTLILITTSKYGAGVSSDAARNLSTANSLLQGKGFVDMLGAPFVLWPPLYPLVMAGLSLLTRLNTFDTAWYLNVLLYAVNIWLAGWLLYRTFPEKPFFAAAGALILLLSRSTLRIYANVASEPLFGTFLLLFFFAAARYLKATPSGLWLPPPNSHTGPSRMFVLQANLGEAGGGGIFAAHRSRPSAEDDGAEGVIWWMFILAGLAMLQRYLGVALFGVAFAAAFYKERWRGLLKALLPALVCAMPIGIWAVVHNIPLSGSPFGPRDLGEMLPLENISLSLTKILWWFIPRLSFTDPFLLRPWTVLAAIVVLLIIINKRQDWLDWLRALSNRYVWPSLAFSVVYFFLLAFTVVTADHLDLTSDRYYVVILPGVLALIFITVDKLVLSHFRTDSCIQTYALPVVLLIWLAYPVYSMQGYLREALARGEPTNYNIANSAAFHEMGVVRAAAPILAQDANAPVYSNYVNIVWFLFRHPVRTLPFEDQTLSREQRIAALPKNYPNWPPERGYIVWFTPNQYHHIAAPDELGTIANLKLLYSDKTGEIYYVEGKK